MKPSPVRVLARRYAAGELSLEEYRQQRRHMIDAMCAGTLKIEYGEPQPRKVTERNFRWLVAAFIIAAVAVGVGVAWHLGARHAAPTKPAIARATPGNPGLQLLRSFTDSNDWSASSVHRFLQQWRKLPAPDKQAARNNYLFPRLLAQLREQIVSQQAMLEIAPDPAAAAHHLAQLQQLSDTLRKSDQH